MSQETIEQETAPFNRISKLRIENYKGIDDLTLRFPAPEFSYEPDIFVIGSENGVGKTSVLECCALARVLAEGFSAPSFKLTLEPDNLFDKVVRYGAHSATIATALNQCQDGNESAFLESVEFSRTGRVIIDSPRLKAAEKKTLHSTIWSTRPEFSPTWFPDIVTPSSNAIFWPSFILLHGFRRTIEGSLNMRNISESSRSISPSYSRFKVEIVKLLMGESGLFEGESNSDVENLQMLNNMIEQFAGGKIGKLKPLPDGSMDLRVTPTGEEESYSFDGLSSGQKEIISTLFTIWHETKSNPKLVLIDEPELHLNASWHRTFVHELTKIAPKNQYILATHSEHIMDSVPVSRRILIERRG